MKTTCFVTLLLILNSYNLSLAQEVEWIADTIFHTSKAIGNSWVLHGKDSTLIIDQDGTRSIPAVEDISWRFLAKGRKDILIIQSQQKTYFQADDLTLVPPQGFDFRIGQYSRLDMMGNTITYAINDTIYVDRLDKANRRMVGEGRFICMENDRYVIFRQDGGRFFYNIDKRKSYELPSTYYRHDGKNAYVIVSSNPEDDGRIMQAVNLRNKKLITPADGFSEYSSDGELVVFYGNGKQPKAFYKGKPIKLPEQIISAEYSNVGDIWMVRTKNGLWGVMDNQGNRITKLAFTEIDGAYLGGRLITLYNKKEKTCYLMDKSKKILFGGAYEKVSQLYKNRFAVVKNGQSGVVDTNHKEIIPIVHGKRSTFFPHKEFGQVLIYSTQYGDKLFYDYDGALILKWKEDQSKNHFFSHYMVSRYNQAALEQLPEGALSKINPYDHWITGLEENGVKLQQIVRLDGTPLSGAFPSISPTKIPKVFVVKTFSGKFGMLRVN